MLNENVSKYTQTWCMKETGIHAPNSLCPPPPPTKHLLGKQRTQCTQTKNIVQNVANKMLSFESCSWVKKNYYVFTLQKQMETIKTRIATYLITSFIEHPFWARLPSSSNCSKRKCEIFASLSSLTSIMFPTSVYSADSGAQRSLSFSVSHDYKALNTSSKELLERFRWH